MAIHIFVAGMENFLVTIRTMKPSSKASLEVDTAGLSEDLLQELHLLTRDKKLNSDAARKLKQIRHLFGFLKGTLEDLWSKNSEPALVDFGAGKSYLGFLIYELFLKHQKHGKLYAVEQREELVKKSLALAQKLNMDRMIFIKGMADQVGQQLPTSLDAVVALHACDTATDDAILMGLDKGAEFFALVPCCQAEVASQISKIPTKQGLRQLFAHPVHAREFGSHLTNVIRSLVLESQGYKVRVTEFVGWEHSQKNELILAQKIQKKNPMAIKSLEYLLEEFPVKMKLLNQLQKSQSV